ncbi:MAG: hypothetical protein P4L16_00785 [Chlamydiales bacterium]|nr:hypothetical protein [Chlamydiales bacterium]
MDPTRLNPDFIAPTTRLGHVIRLSNPVAATAIQVHSIAQDAIHPLGTVGILGVAAKEVAPIALAGVALYRIANGIKNLIKATMMGLGRDISRYVLNLVRDVIDFVSCILWGMPTLLSALKVVATAALRIIGALTLVLNAVIYVWYAIDHAICCYKSNKAAQEIDRILADEKLSPEQQVKKVLEYFLETHFKERMKANLEKLESRLEKFPQKNIDEMWTFLDAQMKVELERVLGAHAYERIKSGLEKLEKGGSSEKLFVDAVDCIRDAREMLRSKIKTEMLKVVTYTLGVVATILGVIFPAFGIGMIVGYSLWTGFSAVFIAEKVGTYVKEKHFNNVNSFFYKPAVSEEIIEKSYKTLCKRIHPHLQTLGGKKANDVGRMLLSEKNMKAYVKEAKEELLLHLKAKLISRAVVIFSDKSSEELNVMTDQVSRASSAKELYKVWNKFDEKRVKVEGPITMQEAKWNNIRERIKLLKAASDSSLFGGALKREWCYAKGILRQKWEDKKEF